MKRPKPFLFRIVFDFRLSSLLCINFYATEKKIKKIFEELKKIFEKKAYSFSSPSWFVL